MESARIRFIGPATGGVQYIPTNGRPRYWANNDRQREQIVPSDEVNWYLNRPDRFELVPDKNDWRLPHVKDKRYRFAKGKPIAPPILVQRNLEESVQDLRKFVDDTEIVWQMHLNFARVHPTAWIVTSQYALGELEFFPLRVGTIIEIRPYGENNERDLSTLERLLQEIRLYEDQHGFLLKQKPYDIGGIEISGGQVNVTGDLVAGNLYKINAESSAFPESPTRAKDVDQLEQTTRILIEVLSKIAVPTPFQNRPQLLSDLFGAYAQWRLSAEPLLGPESKALFEEFETHIAIEPDSKQAVLNMRRVSQILNLIKQDK